MNRILYDIQGPTVHNVSCEEREVSGNKNITNNELTDTPDRLSITNLS